MGKKISLFEVSYWCYYYDLGEEEFDSMLASNNVDFEFFTNNQISMKQLEKILKNVRRLK